MCQNSIPPYKEFAQADSSPGHLFSFFVSVPFLPGKGGKDGYFYVIRRKTFRIKSDTVLQYYEKYL